MVVCRRVFNLNEIATWFDRLTMSGWAPSNDRGGNFTLTPALSHQGGGGLPFYIDEQDGQDFGC